MVPLVGLKHSVPISDLERSIILIKVSWYKHNKQALQMEEESAAVGLHQVANADVTGGVSFMKAMVDFVEWVRTKNGSLAITNDAGKRFYHEEQDDNGKYPTYLKWVWEKRGDDHELLIDNQDVWMDDPPKLWIHVKLAQAIGWLTKTSRGHWLIGPNLRLEWTTTTIFIRAQKLYSVNPLTSEDFHVFE